MTDKKTKETAGEERFVATGKSVKVLKNPNKKTESKQQKKGGR